MHENNKVKSIYFYASEDLYVILKNQNCIVNFVFLLLKVKGSSSFAKNAIFNLDYYLQSCHSVSKRIL